MKPAPIGRIAELTGVKVPTIRYYEQIGLLDAPPRTPSNRRSYGAADVARLRFIRHARELGFEVGAIRQLLDLAADPSRPCDGADAIARRHLEDIDRRIARLTALRDEVARMVDSLDHGSIGECRVIEVLADHAHCAHDHPAVPHNLP